MELENNLNNKVLNNVEIENNNFLDTLLGKAINTGLDIGLRYILPDLIEEEIIEVKDSIIQNGLKDGINTALENLNQFGKSAFGIINGNFENMFQVEKAVGNGGIIDTLSEVLDNVIDKLNNKGIINNTVSTVLKNGKDILLDNVTNNIENTLSNQIKSIEKLNTYIDNWNEFYNNKDFSGMEREYNKIQNKLKEIIPLQETINKTNTLSNLHELIKNNGQNFDLSKEELELANILKQTNVDIICKIR